MGRFRSLFKSDKEKAPGSPNPNPYSPQQSPSPSYDSNPYASGPQGLPPGPRSGGSSGGYGQGSPLPSPYSQDSAPPAYDARSPSNISAYSANQATDFKYPREKFGAADGIGKDRFGGSPASQHGRFAASSSQRQGGYGGLDSPNESLFANYPGPSKQATSPSLSQTGGPDGPLGPDGYPEEREMTEQEREDFEVRRIESETGQVLDQSLSSADRSLAMLGVGHEMMDNSHRMLHEQGEHMLHAYGQVLEAGTSAKVATNSAREVGKSSRWLGGIGEKGRDIRRAQMAQSTRTTNEALFEEERNRLHNREEFFPQQQVLGSSTKIGSSRFDFESEELAEKDELVEQKLNLIHQGTVGLRHKAMAMTSELDSQNTLIMKLDEAVDVTHHGVNKGQAELDIYLRK